MQFLKRLREKTPEKVQEKSPEKPEFQAEKPENIQYIQQTNSHKRLLVFSYGGKHESNKRNKDPS